ncbi:MAG: metal ABC transporter permease [Neomegalonema sp.]|nr:metal ABC transporter permease [Neomegalonema sp.]
MLELITADFMIRAALAGIGVAMIAGPLGCFVVWRRMAYFGDATAHSALLGVALGLSFDLPILFGTALVASALALVVAQLTRRSGFAADTMLGVMSHAALALGMVAISQLPGLRVDLMGYLFGDILAVSRQDVALIWAAAAILGSLLIWHWRALLTATLSEPLARAEGLSPERLRLGFMLALALAVALAMQVTGLLLVTALLILPAAAARALARTPEAMAMMAAGIGALSTVIGLVLAFLIDAPAGPMIVTSAFFAFLTTTLIGSLTARA